MKRLNNNRRPDWHLLLVWLLTVPALAPLVQPTLIRTADGLLHLYRVVALDYALAGGGPLFPRWLPDLAYGYGFPLFIFYAPLSYYITLALSWVTPTATTAFNSALGLALLLAGSSAYLFVKTLFGPKAGLLAGVAYIYAPFQLTNIFSRGGLPAAWAMALFPLAFWGFSRLLQHTGPDSDLSTPTPTPLRQMLRLPEVPLAALIFGAALLTHNTLSLLFGPLLGLYLVITLLARRLWQRQTAPRSFIWPVGLALLLGFGLAGFFLIPAVFEKDFAQVSRVIISPDFDFRFHFVSLDELFALPQPAIIGLLNPIQPHTLGLAHTFLAAIGLVGLLAHRLIPALAVRKPGQRSGRAVTGFTIIGLAGAIFMMLPISQPVWEQLPLLAFVQFPHRLLGPAALVLAILAGAAIATLPKQLGNIAAMSGIVLIFLTAVPLLYPHNASKTPAQPTILDMMAYEHTSGAIGTTSFGEYLPIWVKEIPAGSPLEPMYQTGGPVQRLNSSALPATATVETVRYGFNQIEATVNLSEPHQLTFHTFYFPGWQAQIDGQPAATAPVGPKGLIGVKLPAGQHRLKLSFTETPLRAVANALSTIALLITLGLFLLRRRHSTAPRSGSRGGGFTSPQLLVISGLALLLISLKFFYLDRFDTPLKQTFDGTTVPQAGVSTQINFGDRVTLLGYTLAPTTIAAGETIDLALYWQARQLLATNYSALAQLVDAGQHLYGGQDNLHPGGLRTTRWLPDGFVQDPHAITVPPGTPPGGYFVAAGLYNPETGVRLPIITGTNSASSDVIQLPIIITKPVRIPTVAELGIEEHTPVDFGPELRLLGLSWERPVIVPNNFQRVALFWEAKSQPAVDYQIGLRLLDSGNNLVTQKVSRPSHGRYPTRRWAAGERVRDNHAIWVPANFPPGRYRLQLQLFNAAGQPVGDWVGVSSISNQ